MLGITRVGICDKYDTLKRHVDIKSILLASRTWESNDQALDDTLTLIDQVQYTFISELDRIMSKELKKVSTSCLDKNNGLISNLEYLTDHFCFIIDEKNCPWLIEDEQHDDMMTYFGYLIVVERDRLMSQSSTDSTNGLNFFNRLKHLRADDMISPVEYRVIDEIKLQIYTSKNTVVKAEAGEELFERNSRLFYKALVDSIKYDHYLCQLYLNKRGIDRIEANCFKGLYNLDTLSLYCNKIAHIEPFTFVDLHRLKCLSLYSNELEILHSHYFHGLLSLESLYLNANKISKIDKDCFKEITMLKELHLGFNQLREIDNIWSGLDNLTELNLSHNRIEELTKDQFTGLVNLQYLCLENNSISQLSSESFTGLSALRVLSLKANRLSRLGDSTLRPLVNLKRLYLNENQLESVEFSLFESLTQLELLNLKRNRIKSIDLVAFRALGHLKKLNLSGNEGADFSSLVDNLSCLKL